MKENLKVIFVNFTLKFKEKRKKLYLLIHKFYMLVFLVFGSIIKRRPDWIL